MNLDNNTFTEFSGSLPCKTCGTSKTFSQEIAYELALEIGFFCAKCAKTRIRKSKYEGKGLMSSFDDGITWERHCSECKSKIIHHGKNARANCIDSIRRKRLCKICANRRRWNEEKRKQFGAGRIGSNNPNFTNGLYAKNPVEYNKRYRKLNEEKIKKYREEYNNASLENE